MKKFQKILKGEMLLFVLILICFIFSNSFAQYWNNARDYEPIVMTGNDLSKYLGQSVSQIFAYSYNQAGDSWTQVPLQIDEKDDSSHVWVPFPNNVLNPNDEIIFMARDMGEQVPSTDKWINDEDSRNYERYEIMATDPNTGGAQAFLYFYVSSTLTDETANYMNYTPANSDGADVIYGVSYIEGHNAGGIPDRWEIPVEAGGNGVDLLDRQKARGSGIVYGFLPIDLNEDNFSFIKLDYLAGKVRVSRRLWLSILGLYTFDMPMYYYPFSVDSKGASGTIDPSLVVISHIRQSFDLNREASDMVFSSDNNSNILISGTPDTVNTNLVFKPEVNWFLITGDQGTVLTLTELNELGTTSLYFYDDSTGGSADGKAETGDGQSWGDIGVVITGTAIEGRMSFGYKDYFLSANQSSDLGAEFVSNFKFPLNIVQNSQLVPVELVSFSASVLKSKVLLNWTTLSESNNYGFEVQRKSDSVEFWKVLGFINGQGTSSIPVSYSFADDEISSDHYYYRIKQIDFDGSANYSSTLEVSIQLPQSFQLGQNYPNPFNPETVISYQIPALKEESVEVKLVIYNLLGDEVKTLMQEYQGAGFYSVNWNGKDNSNLNVSAATYIYRIKAGDFVQSRKMTLLR